jgi:hypothetical protein
MTFLNATLLAGAAAGGIPVAIHLLQRRQRKVVRWGAMQLLSQRSPKRNRTLQLDHLLLLVLRTAIPVVLALCMAKPLISGLPSGDDSSPASLVVLFDDSGSMGDGSAGSPLGQIKAAGTALLKALPRGSEISVIPLTDPDAPLVERTTDAGLAAQRILQRTSQASAARINESLDAAATLLTRSHHAKRRLALLSDFQASNWPAALEDARLHTVQRIHAQQVTPRISIFQAPPATTPNTAVESLDFSRLPIGPDQKLRFTATIRNYGEKPRNNVQVQWVIDGKKLSSAGMDIPPKQGVQTAVETTFNAPGPHSVQVSADPDSLPFDDTLTAIVTVHPPIPVLLVNGRASLEALQGETDFLEIALQSKNSPLQSGSSFFQTAVVEPGALGAKSLAQTRTVVLAGVRTLNTQQVRELEAFVKAGGGLIFLPGQQTETVWTNNVLHNNGSGLLPAPLSAFSAEKTGQRRASPSVSKPYPKHPVTEAFQPSESAFDGLNIKAWFAIRPVPRNAGIDAGPAAGNLLSLDSGDVLLLERKYGAGTVIQSAIPFNADWSNLPTRPAFVPLVQRMVSFCAIGSNPDPNTEAGRPLTFQLAPRYGGQSLSVTTPEGKSNRVHLQLVGDKAVGEFTQTRIPGIYQIALPDGETQPYAVNPTREESALDPLEGAAIAAFAKACGAEVSTSADGLVSSARDTGQGREIWRPLVWATLLLMLAELLLSQRFSLPRKAAR